MTTHQPTTRPLNEASTLAAAAYTSPAGLAVETERLLRPSWQYACGLSQLAKQGDTVVTDILGHPVFLVKNSPTTIKAFYNVCQHRGGPLACENKNNRILQCQYHGWTYTLDGALLGAPHMQTAKGFCKDDIKLKEIPTSQWNGLVFVALEPAAVSLQELFQGVEDRIAPINFHEFKYHTTIRYQVQANWKIYVDNYLEGYHVPFVHPTLNAALDFSNYQTEVYAYYSLQQSPLSATDTLYGAQGDTAFYYFVYPNLMLNILPNRLQLNQVIPKTVDSCEVVFHYLYGKEIAESVPEYILRDLKFSDEVQHEDISICEHLQRSMKTGAYTEGRYCPAFEGALHHFHDFVSAKTQ